MMFWSVERVNEIVTKGSMLPQPFEGDCCPPRGLLASWRGRYAPLSLRFPSRSTCQGHPGAQPHPAHHVVRNRIPQGDRLHLLQAPHQQPHQAPIAGLRVDALRRRGAFLVDLLGRLRGHPRTPLGDRRAVPVMRSITILLGIPRLRYGGVDLTATTLRRRRLDVLMLGKAAIDQGLLGVDRVTVVDLLIHRRDLPHVAARGRHLHPHDTVASGSVLEARALSCSPAFFLASSSGSRARACRSRSSRSRAARRWAAACRWPGAAGSWSSSCLSRWICSWASCRCSSRVRRRWNEAAPAEARTRMPSWATRFRSTRSWSRSTATEWVSTRSRKSTSVTRKSDRV